MVTVMLATPMPVVGSSTRSVHPDGGATLTAIPAIACSAISTVSRQSLAPGTIAEMGMDVFWVESVDGVATTSRVADAGIVMAAQAQRRAAPRVPEQVEPESPETAVFVNNAAFAAFPECRTGDEACSVYPSPVGALIVWFPLQMTTKTIVSPPVTVGIAVVFSEYVAPVPVPASLPDE
jgi:hypothetical protein